MAQQNINIGSSANKGDGDPIRVAFTKVNANFTDLYSRVVVLEGGGVAVAQDIQGDIFAQDSSLAYNSATNTHYGSFVGALSGDVTGSVFADNSTVLIDGVAGTISAGALTGALPAIDGSALTGVTVSSITFADLTSTPTTIAGYGIADAYTKTEVDSAITSSVLPSGSTQSIDVVAQDSTVLVDSVNGTLNATTLTGALPAIDGSALTDVAAVTSTTTIFTARADVNLLMGEVVYLTGISGNTPTIDKAQANSASTMPAFGIVKADVTANNNVEVITFGSCPGHDVANFGETGITFALGDTVYVSASQAGKLTNVAPAGESNLIQNIGKIERATPTTNITIKVGGAGRTNATPAVDEGNIFIGDAQNRSSTMSFATAMSTYGGALTGDVTGSVFGDDSTLLVDGVNNKIVGAVETSSLRTSESKIALGLSAGQTTQGTGGIAIGLMAGQTSQAGIAIGSSAGNTTQGEDAVAIGTGAGYNTQSTDAVAIGTGAGNTTQGAESVAIGSGAGSITQGADAVAVGQNAGNTSQGAQSIAIGEKAGQTTQGDVAVAIGTQAGMTTQGLRAIAIGLQAAEITQANDAVAIGNGAGYNNQGQSAIAIGAVAGNVNQAARSIVISAAGVAVNNTTADSLVITPIRNAIGTTMLMYDATSGEVTHSGSIQESFSTTNGATGVTALDCSTGNVHYLTAPAGDITANFTNLNLTAEYATNVTVVIDQGGTEREITAVQIGGVAQTIVWQGNSAPTGTANGVDSFSFTILNDGGTYVVLGQMVAFGGV